MSKLHAVLVGSLMAGFAVRAVLSESDARARAAELSQAGTDGATVVPVSEPKPMRTVAAEPNGKHLVVLGSLGTGFELVGPFGSEDDADEYGEACTGVIENHSVYDVVVVGHG